MSELEWRTAQVRVNSLGEWKLRVIGTDIYYSVYRNRHPRLEPFPGLALIEQLIGLGWKPDRRQMMMMPAAHSAVQRLMLSALAGWKPSELDRNVWTISVYREKPATLPPAGRRQPASR